MQQQTPVTHDAMVVDPGVITEVMKRAAKANEGKSRPDVVADDLGKLTTRDGVIRRLRQRHARDNIIMDKYGRVLVIKRTQYNPGKNKLAVPGGFGEVDSNKGGNAIKDGASGAVTELSEETGLQIDPKKMVKLGGWRTGRRFDVREWLAPKPTKAGDLEIDKHDLVTVTTEAYVTIVDDLSKIKFTPVDTAEVKPGDVLVLDAAKLISGEIAAETNNPDMILGIDDHNNMVAEGIKYLAERIKAWEEATKEVLGVAAREIAGHISDDKARQLAEKCPDFFINGVQVQDYVAELDSPTL